MSDKLLAVELCAGMGGIGLGLRALGFHTARAYDSWAEAVAIYNRNAAADTAVQCNLMSAKGRKRVKEETRQIGHIDLLAAGPPCKGFSQLRNGYHDGRSGHNRVLAVMPDYIAMLRPQMFLIENVPDLIKHRRGKTLSALLSRLESPALRMRYRVDYRIFDAALFGTPQARRRLIILGVRRNAKARLPAPGPDLTQLFSAIRHGSPIPRQLERFWELLRDPEFAGLTSAHQALSDLPILGPGEVEAQHGYRSVPVTVFQRWVRCAASHTVNDTRTPSVKLETLNRLCHVRAGGCARSIPSEHLNGLSRRYDSAYRRLHPDAPSTALSTKYDCVYHYDQPRSLSVREYARLQGIPDHVTFPSDLASRRSAYEMIGNSVPPLLIEHVLGAAMGLRSDAPWV